MCYHHLCSWKAVSSYTDSNHILEFTAVGAHHGRYQEERLDTFPAFWPAWTPSGQGQRFEDLMNGWSTKAAAIWSPGLQALTSPTHSATLLFPMSSLYKALCDSVPLTLPLTFQSYIINSLIFSCPWAISSLHCTASGHIEHVTIHCLF